MGDNSHKKKQNKISPQDNRAETLHSMKYLVINLRPIPRACCAIDSSHTITARSSHMDCNLTGEKPGPVCMLPSRLINARGILATKSRKLF